VVLISRNQAWNIGRLIESVLRETEPREGREVLLVDSASTDETTEIAASYPIDVVRLRDDQPLTPAAGRYLGFRRTSAEFVLYLDGDMELCPGWLEQGLAAMEAASNLAVLTGELRDVLPSAAAGPRDPLPTADGATLEDVRHSGGAALHRRSAVEEVGGFNPFLHSDEEPELCIRVRHAGYRVARIDRPIAYHYSLPNTTIAAVLERRRRRLYLGAGQSIRYHLRDGLLWVYVRERGWGLIPGVGLIAGAWALTRARAGRPAWLRVWLLSVAAFLSADVVRKRSVYRTLRSLVLRLCVLDGTVRGFARTPTAPESYPARFDVVSRAEDGTKRS
jgi:glycosyltransferase involved in cell wall biosynthesis